MSTRMVPKNETETESVSQVQEPVLGQKKKKSSKEREMNRQWMAEYKKTKKGLIMKIYNNQMNHCKQLNRKLPEYSKEDLFEWCILQEKFHRMFIVWENSNYDKNLIPTIDRIDVLDGYHFENIQLLTFEQNFKKSLGERTYTRGKRVGKFNLDWNLIEEYDSISIAAKRNGVYDSNICDVCNGRKKTLKGFRWKHLVNHERKDRGD